MEIRNSSVGRGPAPRYPPDEPAEEGGIRGKRTKQRRSSFAQRQPDQRGWIGKADEVGTLGSIGQGGGMNQTHGGPGGGGDVGAELRFISDGSELYSVPLRW